MEGIQGRNLSVRSVPLLPTRLVLDGPFEESAAEPRHRGRVPLGPLLPRKAPLHGTVLASAVFDRDRRYATIRDIWKRVPSGARGAGRRNRASAHLAARPSASSSLTPSESVVLDGFARWIRCAQREGGLGGPWNMLVVRARRPRRDMEARDGKP